MIPRYEVDPDPRIPRSASFWTPGDDRSEEEEEDDETLGFFHDTEVIRTDLREASFIAKAEIELIQYLDARATTPREFDDLASDVEFEVPDVPSDEAPDFFDSSTGWYGLNQLEVGVAGLVYVLNAVGIMTAASCRSHNQNHRPWSSYPIVVLAADHAQVTFLQPLVEASGCGFEVDEWSRPNFLAIVAPSVVEMMSLTQMLLDAATGSLPTD